MKKLILITASIGGCLILATALALPPGVLVREWSSHIVAGDIELPKDKRSVEKEAEPLEPHKPEIVEELKPVDTAEQLESLESSEGKEMLESFDPAESTPIVDGRDVAGRKGER